MPSNNVKLHQTPTLIPPKTSLPTGGEDQILSMDQYYSWYNQSINDSENFWGERAGKMLSWTRPFDKVAKLSPGFADAPAWFLNGELNACYNCVDRHAFKDPHRTAFIFEADEPGNTKKYTYGELLTEVSHAANYLKYLGAKKGDIITVYMPMCPETLICLLAITRIGAVHSVVFAGFSPNALRDRIQDANSQIVLTADQAVRGGKKIQLKELCDTALKECPDVHTCVVYKRTGGDTDWVEGRDHDLMERYVHSSYCAPTPVNSEDPIFILYTSGSTGKPKGLAQATAGYLLCTMMSNKHVFGVSPGDVFFTAADIGWVTGHSHCFYGPLLNGITTVIYEGTPIYPDHTRIWQIIDAHKATQLYIAPTAIRLLRKFGDAPVSKFKLDSLRVIGSVGEPISEDVWLWFYEQIGKSRCSLVDTYWLTESAMVLFSGIAGVSPMRPGGAGLPFFGVKPRLVDTKGKTLSEYPADGILTLELPWPSLARTIRHDHKRYKETYLQPFPGTFFTGDGASIDKTGFTFITGRVDDVVNVSGHRLSTAEVEAALLHSKIDGKSIVLESAVVGVPDQVTGEALYAFAVLNNEVRSNAMSALVKETTTTIRSAIGSFATPKYIFFVSDLPKTRSGKIMRRILRKIVAGERKDFGELSTLNNPDCVKDLIALTNTVMQPAPRASL